MKLNRRAFSHSLAVLGVSCALPSQAQVATSDYPSKPIRYVVPFPAGGLTDAMARQVGQKLTESLKQAVMVDNKPGASANLGADFVAKAAPDGYTWLAVTLAHAVNQSLFPKLPYSLEKNLTPVVHLANSPLVLVINSHAPTQNLQEFLSQAKGKKLNAGSSGAGTPPHLGLELLVSQTQLDAVHIPYKGGAPSLNDLMGQQIDFIVANLPEAMPYIKAHKLRALGLTSAQRHPLLPNVATFAEQGMAGMALENWTGLMVTAGTDPAVVEKIASHVLQWVKSPEVAERMVSQGFTVTGLGPAEFAAVIKHDVARWRELVRTRNITV